MAKREREQAAKAVTEKKESGAGGGSYATPNAPSPECDDGRTGWQIRMDHLNRQLDEGRPRLRELDNREQLTVEIGDSCLTFLDGSGKVVATRPFGPQWARSVGHVAAERGAKHISITTSKHVHFSIERGMAETGKQAFESCGLPFSSELKKEY